MPVDATTPVPDELDARVEQMLQHMDRVHAEVVNRLEPSADEKEAARSAPADVLEGAVERALRDAAEAAKVATSVAEEEPLSSPPVETAAGAASQSEGTSVPTATIKELDDQLAKTVPAAADDEFADGAQMVEGQSLDVPLPPSSPLGELPAVETPAIAPTPPVVEQAAVAAPAPTPPVPAPVTPAPPAAPKSAPATAAKTAPAQVSKPITPAVITPPKPAGPTLADRFWIVATPVVEPIAVRLGKLPVGFQHTVGWIGIVTLFMAAATWGYVLFFQETRPMSHILEEQMKEHGGAGADEHGEKAEAGGKHEPGDAEKNGKHEAETPADQRGEHKTGEADKSGKAPESKPTETKSPEAIPHAPPLPAPTAKESAKEGGEEHKPAEHSGH